MDELADLQSFLTRILSKDYKSALVLAQKLSKNAIVAEYISVLKERIELDQETESAEDSSESEEEEEPSECEDNSSEEDSQ